MNKLFKAVMMTGGALCLAKGLDNRLEVTHYEVKSEKIPAAFSGFTIAHLSDYHCDTVPGLSEEIRRINPDLIVSTGDLADDQGSYLPALRLCEQLMDTAPVYAVTGNHDLWRGDYKEFERELSKEGVVTLHNERVIIETEGEEISLSGVDDPFTLNSVKANERVRSYLAKIRGYDGYDILLFHRANLFDTVKEQGFDLILSGHMHGGQVRLPGGRGFVAPRSGWTGEKAVFFPKYSAGRFKSPNTEMLVSRGVGNPMIIPRLFNRPELSVITLEHKQ